MNLYVTVPARDQGGGVLTAIGRAFANGPVALAIHAGPGPADSRSGPSAWWSGRSCPGAARSIWLSAVALLAVLGAASTAPRS